MLKTISQINSKFRYNKLENKLSRIGFYRKHIDDSNGKNFSKDTGGAVFFSDCSNDLGHKLVLLFVDKHQENVRILGYDVENDNIVDTPASDFIMGVTSAEEVASKGAEALRLFLYNENTVHVEDTQILFTPHK